jgi:class 3 adenylate cyclase
VKADPQTEAEILQLIERRIATYVTGDRDGAMEMWADDPDIISINTGADDFFRGRAEIQERWGREIDQSDARSVRITRSYVSAHDDIAWASGEAEVEFRAYDETQVLVVRSTYVFIRSAGAWRIVTQHVSTPALTQREGEAFPRPVETLIAAIEHERPDLRQQASPEGVVTLLFTDIEGSTLMNDEIGDQRWIALLREHNEIVRERIAAHGGSEVKTIGDAFMVAFSSARRAVLCAVDLQRAFAAYARQGRGGEHVHAPLRIRIGLHVGEPVREGGDFYGKSVTLASRIADQAKGGEILVSALLKELTDAGGDIAFGAAREAALKEFAENQRLHTVRWDE